jgi:hypothetical protein
LADYCCGAVHSCFLRLLSLAAAWATRLREPVWSEQVCGRRADRPNQWQRGLKTCSALNRQLGNEILQRVRSERTARFERLVEKAP